MLSVGVSLSVNEESKTVNQIFKSVLFELFFALELKRNFDTWIRMRNPVFSVCKLNLSPLRRGCQTTARPRTTSSSVLRENCAISRFMSAT
jgi:hypothetical protein